MLSRKGPFSAVLFDLDGTLVDTAPDMVGTLHALQDDRAAGRIDYALARSHVSNGAGGLIRLAFGDLAEDDQVVLQQDFLDRYAERVCQESRVFPGLDALLDSFDSRGLPWGVVTNKPAALTDALLDSLDLTRRMGCTISGDTLPQRKPHPAPMLLASRELGVDASEVVYVGDAARDIEAGHAAGMATVGACWGYITCDDDPNGWNADALADSPQALSRLLANELR